MHIIAFRMFPYIFNVEISSSDDSEIIIFILRNPGQPQSHLYSFKVLKVALLYIEIITLTREFLFMVGLNRFFDAHSRPVGGSNEPKCSCQTQVREI